MEIVKTVWRQSCARRILPACRSGFPARGDTLNFQLGRISWSVCTARKFRHFSEIVLWCILMTRWRVSLRGDRYRCVVCISISRVKYAAHWECRYTSLLMSSFAWNIQWTLYNGAWFFFSESLNYWVQSSMDILFMAMRSFHHVWKWNIDTYTFFTMILSRYVKNWVGTL